MAILVLAAFMAGAAWLLEHRPAEAVSVSTAVADAIVSAETEAAAEAIAATEVEVKRRPENQRYRALSEFLAKRYKVSQTVTHDLVTIAHAAGHQVGLDPLLIIAVISVESRFNPIAESVAGAKGLMQIIPKYHTDKFREFGGVSAVFDPEANILVGSKIIKEYIKLTGSLDSALQMYAGALNAEENVYFMKVMTEKERLQQVLLRSS
jgi:soluble lytic murein transglycosylase-like protein